MLRLLLLRHAKSDRGTDQGDDRARPINEIGRKAAVLIGHYMNDRQYQPALVLCSTAKRARETWEAVSRSMKIRSETRYEDELYRADWSALLKCIEHAPPASPLMVVGHNPAMEQLAAALLKKPATLKERNFAASMARKFSTAALAVFDFRATNWLGVKPGTGKLIDFVRPKELAPM